MTKHTTWKIGVIFVSKPDVISNKEFANYPAMTAFIKTLKPGDKVKKMANRQWKALSTEKRDDHLGRCGKKSAI